MPCAGIHCLPTKDDWQQQPPTCPAPACCCWCPAHPWQCRYLVTISSQFSLNSHWWWRGLPLPCTCRHQSVEFIEHTAFMCPAFEFDCIVLWFSSPWFVHRSFNQLIVEMLFALLVSGSAPGLWQHGMRQATGRSLQLLNYLQQLLLCCKDDAGMDGVACFVM